jgi:hypothetical protein
MSLIRQLSVLAVCQILGDRADSLLGFLGERFQDHSSRLETALVRANDRAWNCLEVALAGDSWWGSCKALLTARDEQTLQRQIRAFLSSLPTTQLPGDAESFRKLVLADLHGARKAKLVPGNAVSCRDVAEDHARVFARFGDPQSLINRDRNLVEGLADLLRKEGYEYLARYVSLRPAGGQPLLVQAVRYFFRREIEADDRLATALTMEKLDGLDAGMRAGLDGLHEALAEHGQQLTTLLTAMHEGIHDVGNKVTATMEVVSGTHDEVKTLRSQMEQQGEQLRQLTSLLRQMLDQKSQTPAKVASETPQVSSPEPTSARPETAEQPDWTQVRELLARARRAGPESQRKRPDLTKVANQLDEALQQFETTRRAFAHLQAGTPTGPIPIVPVDRPVVQTPSTPSPSGKKLISSIFLTNQPVEPSASTEASTEPKPAETDLAKVQKRQGQGRLLSPLFDPEQEKK